MCRMFGSFGSDVEGTHLESIQRLIPGGPDEQSLRWGEGWVLGHTRLAVNGVMNGSQPYNSFGLHCLFVGEIYNYKELAQLLSLPNGKGAADGEVILPLFEKYGPLFVEKLEGMFSIAIMDVRGQGELFLYTDCCGVKPVYYKAKNGTVSFASEIEGIPNLNTQDRSVSAKSFDVYCSYRAFLGQQTIFPNIKVLEPCSYLHYKDGTLTNEFYKPVEETVDQEQLAKNGFSYDISAGVAKTMITDVPMCTTLSGGLDSSLIATLASSDPRMRNAFNVWYEGDWKEDETGFARQVAKHSDLKYSQVIIEDKQFPDLVMKMCGALSQPNAAAHCLSTFKLYEAIAEEGFKVALVGEGADDFYGGYDRIVQIANGVEGINSLEAYIDDLSAIPEILRAGLIKRDVYNSERKKEFGEYLQSMPGESLLRKILYFESRHRLPYYILHRVDALSMAHSVEARVPFCLPSVYRHSLVAEDSDLVNGEQRKIPIYNAGRGVLPEEVLNREKQPFLLPISGMLKPGYPIYELLMDTVCSDFVTRSIVDISNLNKLIEQNISKPTNQLGNAIWAWLIYEIWCQEHRVSFS